LRFVYLTDFPEIIQSEPKILKINP